MARVSDFQEENLANRWEPRCLGDVAVLKVHTNGWMSGSELGSTRSKVPPAVRGSGMDRNVGPLSQLVFFKWSAATERVA